MDNTYTQVSLAKKLGIEPESLIVVINKPHDYETKLGEIADSLVISTSVNTQVDFIHCFVTERHDLISLFPKLKQHVKKTGMLWVSWPKKASNHPTDINENIVMKVGLENGLVDVKVVAFDEKWSALKFIYRLQDR